jgi:2,5-diketo-D-gluconate reductase A
LQKNKIQAEAWSPLTEGKLNIFHDQALLAIAKKYHKSIPQVILRWLIQRQITVVPPINSSGTSQRKF